MLIKITKPPEIDEEKLMSVYSESNMENTDYFYPQITDKSEALKKVEKDFCAFIKNDFLNGKNIYYVLSVDGVWVSALRLNCLGKGNYYLEALETAPFYRQKGYAAKLIESVKNDLKAVGDFKICDCVSKKNAASLKTHEKCGFKIVSDNGYDYLTGEYDDCCYGLEFVYDVHSL